MHRIERLSQEQLARRVSLHRTEIGFLESGEGVCRIDTLIRLAGTVAIPPEELIEDRLGPQSRDRRSIQLRLQAIQPEKQSKWIRTIQSTEAHLRHEKIEK